MPDAALRALKRLDPGDIRQQARILRAQIRAGKRWAGVKCQACPEYADEVGRGRIPYPWSPWYMRCPDCYGTARAPHEEGVELAAYCGSEAAREVHECDQRPCSCWRWHSDLEQWLSGLSRWPGAPVRAAVAAGRVALPVWEEQSRRLVPVYRVDQRLEAAEAWIACPCEEHREAVEVATVASLPGWAWHLGMAILDPPRRDSNAQGAVTLVVVDLDEPAVRAAICASLVPWALEAV